MNRMDSTHVRRLWALPILEMGWDSVEEIEYISHLGDPICPDCVSLGRAPHFKQVIPVLLSEIDPRVICQICGCDRDGNEVHPD